MGQVLFIVWRESVEAMLVIGILHAWMSRDPAGEGGKPYLWGGVLMGLMAALLLGLGLFRLAELVPGSEEYFQAGMVLVAAGLIVHMVRWMRAHGRTLKQELESGLSRNAAQENWWGVLVLSAIAVAREGSETVVFLYGMLGAAEPGALWQVVLAGLAGFLLALLTFWGLQLGGRIFSWRLFFRVTEVMLLLLGGALFVSGVEKLISLGLLPAGHQQWWDSSWLLDDASPFGGVIASLTGYRAQPAQTAVFAYVLFWLAVWGLMRVRRTSS